MCKNTTACTTYVLNAEFTAFTLKRKANWWEGGRGVSACKALALTNQKPTLVQRENWHRRYCDDYTCGNPLQNVVLHNDVVIDVGFMDGSDSIYWLTRGFRVVATDAYLSRSALRRPVIEWALRQQQLALVHAAIVEPTYINTTISFYRHGTMPELSTRYASLNKQRVFVETKVNVTTCAALIRNHRVPIYMKIDIEGSDAACIRSLQYGKLPLYISTEDPSMLTYLGKLGYKSFKMVAQGTHRVLAQFSGGWSESLDEPWLNARAVRTHPFFNEQHMHERQTNYGWERREHDLHARLW